MDFLNVFHITTTKIILKRFMLILIAKPNDVLWFHGDAATNAAQ